MHIYIYILCAHTHIYIYIYIYIIYIYIYISLLFLHWLCKMLSLDIIPPHFNSRSNHYACSPSSEILQNCPSRAGMQTTCEQEISASKQQQSGWFKRT